MVTAALIPEQEEFVWRYICRDDREDDDNPLGVIQNSYGGDRSRYLAEMARWHGIKFCHYCRQGVIVGDGEKFTGFCQSCVDQWRFFER